MKTKPPLPTIDHEPSPLAMKHEREITELRAGHEGIIRELGAVNVNLQKNERHLELFADEMRGQFARITQPKSPTIYMGAITILFGALTLASGLTIFTINSLNSPMRVQLDEQARRFEAMEARERTDHDLLVRLDEREKMRQGK